MVASGQDKYHLFYYDPISDICSTKVLETDRIDLLFGLSFNYLMSSYIQITECNGTVLKLCEITVPAYPVCDT